jgi:hypothetical protein
MMSSISPRFKFYEKMKGFKLCYWSKGSYWCSNGCSTIWSDSGPVWIAVGDALGAALGISKKTKK